LTKALANLPSRKVTQTCVDLTSVNNDKRTPHSQNIWITYKFGEILGEKYCFTLLKYKKKVNFYICKEKIIIKMLSVTIF